VPGIVKELFIVKDGTLKKEVEWRVKLSSYHSTECARNGPLIQKIVAFLVTKQELQLNSLAFDLNQVPGVCHGFLYVH